MAQIDCSSQFYEKDHEVLVNFDSYVSMLVFMTLFLLKTEGKIIRTFYFFLQMLRPIYHERVSMVFDTP